MKPARVLLAAVAILVLGAFQTASADGSGSATVAPDITANATLTTSATSPTTGTWTLTFDVVNGSANTVDINSFSLSLFQPGPGESFTITSETVNGSSSLGPWEFFPGEKNNNGNAPDCSVQGMGIKGDVCGDTSSGGSLKPFDIAPGKTLVITLSGTFTDTNGLTTFDLLASGCTDAGSCKLDGGSNNGDKWAFSNTLTPTTTTVTPEPVSLLLLGTGMSALGLVRRRKQA
jgi:hypothetical protein